MQQQQQHQLMDRSRSIIMYMARIQKRMWWWLREIENAENSPPLTKGEEEVQSASLTYTNKRFILPSSSSLGQMQRDQDALRWDAYRWIFYGVEKRGSDSEREKMAKKCISPQKLNFSSAPPFFLGRIQLDLNRISNPSVGMRFFLWPGAVLRQLF